jgi:phosphatidylinositol alpha-1,6-mannosyltransferase
MATSSASPVRDERARRRLRAPALAAITLARGSDGVAVVSNLLWRALQRRWPDARLLTLFDGPARVPGMADKASFTATLMTELAAHRPCGIVYSHLGLARAQAYVPSIVARPYVVFLHGVEAWGSLGDVDLRLLQRASLRLANSSFTAARVAKAHPSIGPVVPCPLALLDDATGASLSGTTLDPVPLPTDGPIVLIVGRMHASEAYKGHDQLIEAWPAVIARVPDAYLVVAGDGNDRPRLEHKARLVTGGERIRFLGFAPPPVLEACYQTAAVFALPSRGEGFGLVYLEAMARGLPCVGSRQDAAGDVIVDGTTGRLVEQASVPELASAIVGLLGDDNQRRAMGEAGRRRFAVQFSEAAFSRRLLAALEPVFDGSTR